MRHAVDREKRFFPVRIALDQQEYELLSRVAAADGWDRTNAAGVLISHARTSFQDLSATEVAALIETILHERTRLAGPVVPPDIDERFAELLDGLATP